MIKRLFDAIMKTVSVIIKFKLICTNNVPHCYSFEMSLVFVLRF